MMLDLYFCIIFYIALGEVRKLIFVCWELKFKFTLLGCMANKNQKKSPLNAHHSLLPAIV